MLVDILNRQSAAGHKVGLFIINDQVNETLLQQISGQVQIVRLNRKQGGRNPIPLLRLNRMLIGFAANVIHCHNHKAVGLLLPRLRRKALLTLHTTRVPVANLKQYARLYAISEAVQTDVHNRSGLSAAVIYNGIDLDAIAMRTKPSDASVFRMVQVGRLDHEVKGQHILLEALKILKDKGVRPVRLDLIGEGASTPFLLKLRESLGLDEEVRFLGARDRKYIYGHLRDYDLLVQPSFVEGFGLTIVEAIAAGIPVVVSDIDGPMELIGKGSYGRYFKTGDSGDLARVIEEVMQQDAEAAAQHTAALAHVRRHFDIQQTVQSYLEQYATL